MILTNLNVEALKLLSVAVNKEENPVVSLGIDPGKSNGICGYDSNYNIQFMYTVDAEDVLKFLDTFEYVTHTVVEDYFLYPNKASQQYYSNMETSRVIGRIEGWAARKLVTLIKQGASVKKTGYAWIGKKPLPKSNPKNHELDAHVHFMFWAIKSGRISASSLVRKTLNE